MWKNNSLSICMFVLFALSLGGQSYAGWRNFNEGQRLHAEAESTYVEYIQGSDFGEAVFENWESEFLQMSVYVLLTVFLYQVGSAESKRRDRTHATEEDPLAHASDPGVPWPVRRGGWSLTLYKNSLGLALFVLFLISFIGHAASGSRRYSAELAAHGVTAGVTTMGYLMTPRFWYESLENWQSEFLSVFAIVVLSIWLRQWGSPESKPVHASHRQTGE